MTTLVYNIDKKKIKEVVLQFDIKNNYGGGAQKKNFYERKKQNENKYLIC